MHLVVGPEAGMFQAGIGESHFEGVIVFALESLAVLADVQQSLRVESLPRNL